MSNIYVTEPPTNGKVLLTTNRGEIEIELWSREAPKASRNFIQLCLEGYYIDTIFHRIVSNFIIQGGDPTGTGTGGQSIFDAPFPDEFHSRLKYNRRGLVGMANNGENDNGSQFFITLDATAELQGRNTLFGRIAGDTIYNVTKIGNSECEEGTDRPLYPPRIIKTEVIVNPFQDIKPRTTREELEARQKEQLRANIVPAKKWKKNTKLLSFDDGEDEDVVVKFKSRGKSSHDVLTDDRLAPAPTTQKNKSVPRKRQSSSEETDTHPPQPKERTTASKLVDSRPTKTAPRPMFLSPPPTAPVPQVETTSKADEVALQIAQLTSSMKRKHPSSSQSHGTSSGDQKPKLSYLEQQKAEYAKKALLGGRKKGRLGRGFTEDDTLSKLSMFQTKLASASTSTPAETSVDAPEVVCTLHAVPNCHSCRLNPTDVLNDNDDEDDEWFHHTLIFEQDKLGKDQTFKESAEMELEVIDPRQKAGQLALQQRKARREREEKGGRNQYGGK